MKLKEENILGLPVFTKSRDHLGKVHRVVFEMDSLDVASIEVKPANLIKALIEDDLIISNEQIVSISEKEVVVEDSIVAEHAKLRDKIAALKKSPAPSMRSMAE
ncbi:MAG: hypothetical protein HOJ15_01390 [Candidatus Jacksonbacteria bacterium]|jgi:uncharacterized protein YrrD|nr:hypothetical protein [Candidatus Jacksonbacteria bacterium]MBT6034133.1 hypothetical protein [Candidatus Jacksonbacteria bacterium]MBT6301063.1 hypothetical protein [Candidatus Jacksonbacteria bacterium]MBT6756920.1 hypothetical protein [Candidatus Jacksonbacteria bacterium]MBT6955437.1 hypothetical protein [Candidatus Jacksonbacteria bacterium]